MLGGLKKVYAGLEKSMAPKTTCPRCLHEFARFTTAAPPADYSAATHSATCPRCAFRFRFDEAAEAGRERELNPPGPFSRPPRTRITMVSEGETRIFRIPGSRGQLFLVMLLGLWLMFLGLSFVGCLVDDFRAGAEAVGFFGIASLVISGFILFAVVAGSELRTCHVIIRPESVQVRLEPIFCREYVAQTREITGVRRWQDPADDDPKCFLQIVAAPSPIQFGIHLSEAEQHWLRWEMQQLLALHGAPLKYAGLPSPPQLTKR